MMLIANVYPLSNKLAWVGLFLWNGIFSVISRCDKLKNFTEPIYLDEANKFICS